MNAKPFSDNKERSKSKKKKEPVDVRLDTIKGISVDGVELSGEDIAAYADALAGAKKAMASIQSTINEAESVLKAAMLCQYYEYLSSVGHGPDMRRGFGKMSSFQVVQQESAKVTAEKLSILSSSGIEIEAYEEKKSYTIRLAAASKESTREILESLRGILDDDFDKVVSEYTHVGKGLFGNLTEVVKRSLRPGERLDEKVLQTLRILNPTIQFSKFESDLSGAEGYDLAHEFAQISANKKRATKSAEESVRRSKK